MGSVAVSNCNDFWDELGCVTAQSRSFSRWCKHLCMWVVACLFVFYCVFCGGEAVSDCHGFWDMSQLGRGVIAFDRCVCVYVGGFVGAVCG